MRKALDAAAVVMGLGVIVLGALAVIGWLVP
jgi:hypothetical protein